MALEKILYTDNLRSGTDKINASIDLSNDSKIESASAKATANSAVVIANTANGKSDSTQAQLNNIIIESGTSDAETIQARDEFPLLNDRLNNADQQLVETNEIINRTEEIEMQKQNASIISIDSSLKLKHLTDPFATYRAVKDWNASDSTDKVFAPAMAKHNGILYVIWRSASGHVSNDGKIKMRKSPDNGLTWETSDAVVLNNTADSFIYNMNFITTATGNFIIIFFDRNAQQKVQTKFITSVNLGVTWSAPKLLPKPSDVEETAMCGAHTIKSGVIYQTGYTLDNRVYVIKSTDEGMNWVYVGYVSQTEKLNEASITYVPKDGKFYLVARSGEQKPNLLPYGDYENFLIVGESTDAVNWVNFHKIPVYGHAPWSCVLSDDKMVVSYANRSAKYTDGKYSCDVIVLQHGEPITNSIRLNTSTNFDSYYSSIINDGTHVHLVYYQEQIALRYHRFTAAQLDILTMNEFYVPNELDNASYLSGHFKTTEGLLMQWQEESFNLNLTSYTFMDFTLKKPFVTRGFFVGANLYSNDPTKLTTLQNIMCETKLKNATTVQVVLRNMSGANITLTDVKLKVFAIGN